MKKSLQGLTLLELLVVIAIIGILASIGLPAMRGLGGTNLEAAVQRQVLDDLAFARMRAISDRTAVYMVFVPPRLFNRQEDIFDRYAQATTKVETNRLANLIPLQLSGYALVAGRTVGDQPGQQTPRYLTEWRSLPSGMYFAPHKFDPSLENHPDPYLRAFSTTNSLPFPDAEGAPFALPYIAFNAEGQLMSKRDETVGVVKASVFYPKNDDGSFRTEEPDVVLTPGGPDQRPPTNVQYFRINWLTGRAEAEVVEFE